MHPPPLWEFLKLPWCLVGLAVKIFRRDPHLSPNVADVVNDISTVPVSRAAMKRQKQMENMEESSSVQNIRLRQRIVVAMDQTKHQICQFVFCALSSVIIVSYVLLERLLLGQTGL
jgi:hypothetical protein